MLWKQEFRRLHRFSEFSYACRTGKYPGRNRCYCSGWTGGPVLDVDICVFGMAVAYMEGVLAQIFKEKKDDEFVGGLPFYGRKLLGNKVWIGVFLSVLYILYALCCLPAQGFNVVSSVGRMAEIITGKPFQADQPSII